MELIIGLVILAILVFVVIGIYNKLVTLKNRYENAFAQIEVQLKRRYDLIPNLVETARAYMSHERETLEAVIAARNQAASNLAAAAAAPGSPLAMTDLSKSEGVLTGALGRLNMVMEAYPDLKANQTIQNLLARITGLENAIADRREFYNESVNLNNVRIEQFPDVIVARLLGFGAADLLVFSEEQKKDVDLRALFRA